MQEITIDLTKDPEDRWKHTDPSHIKELADAAEAELHAIYPVWLLRLAEKCIHALTAYTPTQHVREIEGLAAHAGITPERLLLLNLSYDITASGCSLPGMLGCTGALHRDRRGALRLSRAMDWAFPEAIRDYSMLVRFQGPGVSVLTVGFPGCIGALTGVNAHGVAVALNQAFVLQMPNWAPSVPWLVRETLIQASSYESALKQITTSRAMSSGFYLVTDGTAGALIESTGLIDKLYHCEELLTVANHFRTDKEPVVREWGDSHERHATLHSALERGLPAKRALRLKPVEHGYTAHQIVLDPRKRKIEVRCPNSQEPRWETFYVAS